MSKIEKVVLAYSGGLDTSIILKWIKNEYNCEVITLTADLGQGEELDGIEEKALRTGATKAFVEDLREEFARDFIFPAFVPALSTKAAICSELPLLVRSLPKEWLKLLKVKAHRL